MARPGVQSRKPRSFLADTLALGGATGLGQLLLVASAPLLSRLYTPEEVASYGLFLALLMFAATAANLKYELAIPGPLGERQALSITVAATIACIPVALATALAAATTARAGAFGLAAADAPLMALVGPALAVTGAFTALRYWHVRQQRFTLVGRAMLAQSTGRAVVPVAFGALGFGWSGLVAGEIAGRAIGLWWLASAARSDVRVLGGLPGRAEVATTAREQRRYPTVVMPASMLDALAAFLPLPVFVAAFGPAAGGQLALVQRLLSVPASLVATSVGDVLHARAGAAVAGGHTTADVLVDGVIRRLSLIAAAVYLPVLGLATVAFQPVFGAQWDRAGGFAALLAPMVAAWTVASPLTRVFLIRDRLRLKLAFDFANLVLPIGALVLASRAGPTAALGAYSVAACVVALGVVISVRRVARDGVWS